MKHEITRVRHELKRRHVTVRTVDNPTPGVLRIELAGDSLNDFTSLSPDDHIKVFVPGADSETERRDYTPRRFDTTARTLTLDFALHDAGPATAWARGAQPGDTLEIAGPRGSMVVPQDFDWWLLIGDETALPAIGRRIEELNPETPVMSLVAIASAADEAYLPARAGHAAHWVHRPLDTADDPAPLLGALRGLTLPPGEGFVWIAAEARVARALRGEMTEALGHPRAWLKANGYWIRGEADANEKMDG